jgi:hypothetical protein
MRTLFITTLITLAASTAHAQALGYGVAGPAGTMGFVNTSRITFNAAGGGEVFLARYFAVGGEGGFFDRLITASVNGALHLVSDDDRMAPFVTAGYSRMGIGDGEGSINAWNIGAGADAWLGDRAGIRFELRDHIRPDRRGTTHYWTFRAGVVFR